MRVSLSRSVIGPAGQPCGGSRLPNIYATCADGLRSLRHADYLIGAGCAARTLRRSFIRAGCTAATGEGQGHPVLERARPAMAPGGGGR